MRKLLFIVLALCSMSWAGTVKDVAKAIAKAEGYGIPGALPTRYHNPGDLKAVRWHFFPGQIGIGKGGHAIFKNDTAGLAALVGQINRIVEGRSKYYRPGVTIQQMAHKYAGDWKHWSRNVARSLGVSEDTSLYEYLELPKVICDACLRFSEMMYGGFYGEDGSIAGFTLLRETAPDEIGSGATGAGSPSVHDDHREAKQSVPEAFRAEGTESLERWLAQKTAALAF
jgi:hypothetical protein